ncbi:hypothetical protein [Kribbella sp. NPDC051770]|uniref:hypothetical protein n=1 Tax=Kribbella sp. NPDC051770 TaxID=3155413 RepID=UPI0034289871
MEIFVRGREFVRRDARLLERRLFSVLFEDGDPAGVVDALRGYRNADGGFGHGLEPDKRCPDSTALDVETAFDAMIAAGVRDEELIGGACDWLQSVATPEGAVSLCNPAIEGYPRADHMSEWTYVPSLNPTAGLVGRLHQLEFEHPWRDQATAWCQAELANGLPGEGHSMLEVLRFLEHQPDPGVDAVRAWLPKLSMFRANADDPTYGVTPLHFAPTPDSVWRQLFTQEQIDGHLDRLVADQDADGGWALTWEPPGPMATLEYRGVVTVAALDSLRRNGRLSID